MVLGSFACLVAGGQVSYTSQTVHMIYAIPSDRDYEPRYATAMGEAIIDVQKWYRERVGETFDIAATSPQVCHLAHEADHYAGEGGWDRVTEDVQHCAPVRNLAQWETWVIYPDVDPCGNSDFELGRGGSGKVNLHSGDLHGISISDSETYAPCDWPKRDRGGWIGGLAHELGHALGLPHPDGCVSGKGCDESVKYDSLMWHGMYHYPETHLLDVDKAYLKKFFSDPIVRCQRYGNEKWCKQEWGKRKRSYGIIS